MEDVLIELVERIEGIIGKKLEIIFEIVLIGDGMGEDEEEIEIGVDKEWWGWRIGEEIDGKGEGLIREWGEIGDEVEKIVEREDKEVEERLLKKNDLKILKGLIIGKMRELGIDGGGNDKSMREMLLGNIVERGDERIEVWRVKLGKVEKIEKRIGGEKVKEIKCKKVLRWNIIKNKEKRMEVMKKLKRILNKWKDGKRIIVIECREIEDMKDEEINDLEVRKNKLGLKGMGVR